MTRGARHASRVATRPSPRSCGFAHPRRFPSRLVWHARREGRLRAGDAAARERDHDRGMAADDRCLLPLGEERPCPRPVPCPYAWMRSGVTVPRGHDRSPDAASGEAVGPDGSAQRPEALRSGRNHNIVRPCTDRGDLCTCPYQSFVRFEMA
jgi:hypothetical protein